MDKILEWFVALVFALVSITLLMGKGSFLIAGYNTSCEEEKQKYNLKKLCRVIGGGFSILTVMVACMAFFNNELPPYLEWMMPWGYLGVIFVLLILSNTICKKKYIK